MTPEVTLYPMQVSSYCTSHSPAPACQVLCLVLCSAHATCWLHSIHSVLHSVVYKLHSGSMEVTSLHAIPYKEVIRLHAIPYTVLCIALCQHCAAHASLDVETPCMACSQQQQQHVLYTSGQCLTVLVRHAIVMLKVAA